MVHESPKVGGVGAELVSYVCEHHLDELDAPPVRLGLKHVPIPFSPPLEQFVAPQKDDVLKAAMKLVRG